MATAGPSCVHRVLTHLEGVEEVPEGPGVYHVVVHGEEEGDDDTGDACGHGGRFSVNGKTQNAQGPIKTCWGFASARSCAQGMLPPLQPPPPSIRAIPALDFIL